MTIIPTHHRSTKPAQRRKQLPMLPGDSRLIIVAGNENTAATLKHLFKLLATDPTLVPRLREEIGPIELDSDDVSNARLVDASFLNRIIDETLQVQSFPPLKSEAKEEASRNVGNESVGSSAAETEYTELVKRLKTKYAYDWSRTPEALVK